MTRLLIVEPLPFTVVASRGTGAANLASANPKEVWADTAIGKVTLDVDLGAVRAIDTMFLGFLRPPDAAASWAIRAGVAAADTLVQPVAPLAVPDVPDDAAATAHALWHGTPIAARYLSIDVTQPAGTPLTAGVLAIGKAFVADFGQEWGAGRQPIDTGTATSLPSGGFAVVEGVRKLLYAWTFGDLSVAETEQLETIALHLGETRPGLVVENAGRTAGLRRRIHWGLFRKWRAFERRNARQTRWEISIEQWL